MKPSPINRWAIKPGAIKHRPIKQSTMNPSPINRWRGLALVPLALLISAGLVATGVLPSPPPTIQAAQASEIQKLATVLVYHRFGEDHIPSTNTPLADFEAHLAELRDNNWNVIPAADLIDALEGKATLPERAVVITIDDAYRSTYEVAWKRFRAYGFPFTLAIATEPLEQKLGGYMTWQEVREMAADPLVTLAHHSHDHGHLVNYSVSARASDLEQANKVWRRELGAVPWLYTYPYGEYSEPYEQEIRAAGFRAAFAQHSGPVWTKSNRFALTRYAMSGTHTSVSRLNLALKSQPMGVIHFTPSDPFLKQNPPPTIEMTIDEAAGNLNGLTCYLGGNVIATEQTDRTIKVLRPEPLPLSRSRLNCTLSLGGGVWRWFGALLYLPGADD